MHTRAHPVALCLAFVSGNILPAYCNERHSTSETIQCTLIERTS